MKTQTKEIFINLFTQGYFDKIINEVIEIINQDEIKIGMLSAIEDFKEGRYTVRFGVKK